MAKLKYPEDVYPRYYNVDDIPVIIEEDGDDAVGKIANGRPYPIGKAIVEGYQITEKEYKALAKERYNLDL